MLTNGLPAPQEATATTAPNTQILHPPQHPEPPPGPHPQPYLPAIPIRPRSGDQLLTREFAHRPPPQSAYSPQRAPNRPPCGCDRRSPANGGAYASLVGKPGLTAFVAIDREALLPERQVSPPTLIDFF